MNHEHDVIASNQLAPDSNQSFDHGIATPVNALTRDFLAWIASTPRTYADAMEAWRSSCPRLTIWEDALDADLFRVNRTGNQRLSECLVVLTPRGHALLEDRISL